MPRDAAFAELTRVIGDLDTRRLGPHEMVLCVDEKTSQQSRPRRSPTRPARPDQPVRVEHEYDRNRPKEFLEFLEQLDREIPTAITTVSVVLDKLRRHKGKQVQAWLAKYPRFVFHQSPVHCNTLFVNRDESGRAVVQHPRV